MLFYKATGTVLDEKWVEENNDRRMRIERAFRIGRKSEAFNRRFEGKRFCFLSEINESTVSAGIITTEIADERTVALDFMRKIGLSFEPSEMTEITLSVLSSMLRSADRNDFIDDDDTVLEQFGLKRINERGGNLDFGEDLLEERTRKDKLYAKAEELLAGDTLTPELDRIYSGKTDTKAFGHPVHYMIQTDNPETRAALEKTLLQALYGNGRLQNRRFCVAEFRVEVDFSKAAYRALYKSCVGGAMVVRYRANGDEEESDYAGDAIRIEETLCEVMQEFRNRVLTVFCLPRSCEKVKKHFQELLGSTGIVEIREELADAERSRAYLKMLARKSKIRTDEQLFARLEADQRYLPDELHQKFEEWYNQKMRTSVFPQYKDLVVCREQAAKEPHKGSAYRDLEEMIGLGEAKAVIGKALDYYKMQRLYRDHGIPQVHPAMHMAFTGNPGTAKTTVARLFAQIMKENGLLSGGQLVEVGRADLVARYVGWTAKTIQEKFKKAKGGVLFIDEAYSLLEDRNGSFGDEAINTIVQEMENQREDLVVIFAGYPKEMEQFLNKNPGFRSRIAFHVSFSDYTAEELCEIAQLISRKRGFLLTDGAVEKMRQTFETARKDPNFGNGRYVRNLLELSGMNQAVRVCRMDCKDVTQKVLQTINEEDIEVPSMTDAENTCRIGFLQ